MARFVVAGAVVALFGGYLLAEVLTQQPTEVPLPPAASPTVSWDPPSELAVEEVAPGVMKSTDPGVRGIEPGDFTFDQRGDMWLLSPDGLQHVGDGSLYPSPGSMGSFPDLTPGPDGTLWAVANGTVASFRDGTWTDAPAFPGEAPAEALEVLPDGTVWARSSTTLARLDGDTWTAYPITDEYGPVPDYEYVFPGDLAWTPDGSLWVTTCHDSFDENGDPVRVDEGSLLRFDGTAFHPLAPPVPLDGCHIGPLAGGASGELWAYLERDPYALAMFDGTGWELSGDDAGIPQIQRAGMDVGMMVVTPDGLVWASRGRGWAIGAYDGTTWTDAQNVPQEDLVYGLSERPLHVAPDGSIWVWTSSGDFLIISPEALADRGPEAVEPALPDEQAVDNATIDELLSGVDLVTEEVEPGVYRVRSDGVRDLSDAADRDDLYLGGIFARNIAAGLDGSVWWFGPDGLFRLGDAEQHPWSDSYPVTADVAVGPDGTLAFLWGPGHATVFDGRSWSEQDVEPTRPTVWLIGNAGLDYYDGDGWERLGSPYAAIDLAAAGPDGTVWIKTGEWSDPTLARFDGSEWEEFPGQLPPIGGQFQGHPGWLRVAPDGSAWFNPAPDGGGCDGVANVDGKSIVRFMRGTCIYAMDVAADGSVWLQAGEWQGGEGLAIDTYLITPGALLSTDQGPAVG